jgi:hypothetical protein
MIDCPWPASKAGTWSFFRFGRGARLIYAAEPALVRSQSRAGLPARTWKDLSRSRAGRSGESSENPFMWPVPNRSTS